MWIIWHRGWRCRGTFFFVDFRFFLFRIHVAVELKLCWVTKWLIKIGLIYLGNSTTCKQAKKSKKKKLRHLASWVLELAVVHMHASHHALINDHDANLWQRNIDQEARDWSDPFVWPDTKCSSSCIDPITCSHQGFSNVKFQWHNS